VTVVLHLCLCLKEIIEFGIKALGFLSKLLCLGLTLLDNKKDPIKNPSQRFGLETIWQ
jgi:hypothetical protein